MAVKMNATTYGAHKDFRKHIDIKKKMKHGTKDKRITLPPEDFAYRMRNRTPTPVKDVINNAYGNRAEEVIGMEYQMFMKEKQAFNKLAAKTTSHFDKLLQTRKMACNVEEKPLYKMKMFKDIPSKVAEGVKNFKTYKPMKQKDNIDHLIEKVEKDIQNQQVQ
jgi:hypothetical protein